MDPKNEAAYKLMFRMIKEHFENLEHEEADQTQRLSQRVVYDSIRVRPNSVWQHQGMSQ